MVVSNATGVKPSFTALYNAKLQSLPPAPRYYNFFVHILCFYLEIYRNQNFVSICWIVDK